MQSESHLKPLAAPQVPSACYGEGMERFCAQCHAVLDADTQADWCPACGGALIERPVIAELASTADTRAEVDHRGIVLPRRHALGGIITPQ